MVAFQLDTSGTVLVPHATPEDAGGKWASDPTQWSDLSPFTQGYIEAMMRANYPALHRAAWERLILPPAHVRVGFSDLAPETLARIIADCEKERARLDGPPDTIGAGKAFWIGRNTATRGNEYHATGVRPLTVQLGDDGKVRFANATAEAA